MQEAPKKTDSGIEVKKVYTSMDVPSISNSDATKANAMNQEAMPGQFPYLLWSK